MTLAEQIVSTLLQERQSPDPNWRVTVQGPQVPGDKGYVQIDDISGGVNRWSKGPDLLRREGYDVPNFLVLPTGHYTWAQAVAKLSDVATPPKATFWVTSGSGA